MTNPDDRYLYGWDLPPGVRENDIEVETYDPSAAYAAADEAEDDEDGMGDCVLA